jgi:hypothetical protein
MNFFIETCIETSGSPIKKQIVLTEWKPKPLP